MKRHGHRKPDVNMRTRSTSSEITKKPTFTIRAISCATPSIAASLAILVMMKSALSTTSSSVSTTFVGIKPPWAASLSSTSATTFSALLFVRL